MGRVEKRGPGIAARHVIASATDELDAAGRQVPMHAMCAIGASRGSLCRQKRARPQFVCVARWVAFAVRVLVT